MEKILIADDSDIIRDNVRDIPERRGYDVTIAVDGRGGPEQAPKGAFRLIITDYHMPHLDGLEMTREIRKIPDYDGVNIIMLTTGADASLRSRDSRPASRPGSSSRWMRTFRAKCPTPSCLTGQERCPPNKSHLSAGRLTTQDI